MLSGRYTRTKPILPIDDLTLVNSSHELSSSSSLATTGFRNLLRALSNFSPLIQSLQELLFLTGEVRSLRRVLASHDQLLSFTARRSWVEWSLSASEYFGIEDCVRLAALIYTNLVLRKMHCASAVLHHLMNDLKNALNDTSLPVDWEEKKLLLLWVLFQSGVAATEEDAGKWYLARLVRECHELGLQTWNQVMDILDSFLWAGVILSSDASHCGLRLLSV
jgi:hypothetical protein